MISLKTENKEIKLRLSTRKIVDIVRLAGVENKNFEEYFFRILYNRDLKALTEIIYTLIDLEPGENRPFNSSTEIYDFIDDYKYENNKSYDDIFNEIAMFINEEGFFNKKMSFDELEEKKKNLMTSLDMDKLMENVMKDVSKEVAKEEMIEKKSIQDQNQFKGFEA